MTLVAERLRVAFPAEGAVPVVDANFQIPHGKVLALCGANGSGKTTLARAVLGLVPELIPGTVEGRLTWQNAPLPPRLHQRLGLVGYTFQDVDSQILFGTVADVLGLNDTFQPKFLKRYAEMAKDVRAAIGDWAGDVRSGAYPDAEHSF